MQASQVHPLHSDDYLALCHFFEKNRPPYTLWHIGEFNAIYRRVYPRLGRVEKRKAEEFVDHMIDHVEQPKWVSKIYGVV